MNPEYHVIQYKDGMTLYMVARADIADRMFKNDLAILTMNSYYTIGEMLDVVFNVPNLFNGN